ncbi:FtsX-like permease family protein [Cellulomonas xiejunii]|uniref:ABC transporter permease n=1 Tax=Cellulomonas xiejunii TaxID=2968083 RepID=A0ABY5KT40_9CELL|nr:ABC transporter permease [Cellulomonas xiejunii]MCC2322162.1 ABC transporter permease [Cellulomonas xiejunii]MCC2323195.1 ABC transporter permease [Cellulomonas xiejunii]UUI73667.1 ABC transporter permease [Cellulomonas xiejunii]
MWQLASTGVRAHRGAFAGTAVVLAVAAAVLAITGVLFESGTRLQSGGDSASGSLLVSLASSYAGTLIVVVVMVVAATVSLALRSRRREFALLRAVGATPSQVRRTVTLEVGVVSLVAAPLGAIAGLFGARLLDPVLVSSGMVAPDFTSALSPLPVLAAVALIVVTAVPVGRLGAREAARTDPTAALQQSAVEDRQVGIGRRLTALAMTLGGLAMAFSTLFIPGTMGAAMASLSAFLLVGAAALAGPVLVGWIFDRVARMHPSGGRPATMLAVRNVRGFSRRLTTVVVPLALVVAAATVQTSVNRAISEGAEQQFVAAVEADLVVTPTEGASPDLPAQVAAVPGVASTVPLASVPGEMRTDAESGAMGWEATALRVLPLGTAAVDPDVVKGSLDGIDAPDTVAVSTDTAFMSGAGVGETLTLRLGEDVVDATVVAVYSRGMGVGAIITGPATAEAHGLPVVPDTLLVDLADGADTAGATAAITALGATAADPETHIATAMQSAGGENDIGVALLLLLLGVVAVGAASTLAMTTMARRDELALLHRTGTTRRQLMGMTTVEAAVTGVTAWVLGTVAVVPAVIGVSAGVLDGPPVVDLLSYGIVSGAVVVFALVATALAARRTTKLATAVA